MTKNHNLGILILRIAVGGLMLFHGIDKLGGIEGIKGLLSSKGLPEFVAYGIYLGEILAPIMIILGFRTRLAALIYIVNCLAAIGLVHAADVFTLNQHGGWGIELVASYALGALALFFIGGGDISLSQKINGIRIKEL